MIGCCGIDCGVCNIRKAANDRNYAETLAEEWRKTSHPNAQAEWFRCQGCHGEDSLVWTEDCKSRACCKGKNLDNCGLCGEFPCGPVKDDGMAHHAAAFARLRDIASKAK